MPMDAVSISMDSYPRLRHAHGLICECVLFTINPLHLHGRCSWLSMNEPTRSSMLFCVILTVFSGRSTRRWVSGASVLGGRPVKTADGTEWCSRGRKSSSSRYHGVIKHCCLYLFRLPEQTQVTPPAFRQTKTARLQPNRPDHPTRPTTDYYCTILLYSLFLVWFVGTSMTKSRRLDLHRGLVADFLFDTNPCAKLDLRRDRAGTFKVV